MEKGIKASFPQQAAVNSITDFKALPTFNMLCSSIIKPKYKSVTTENEIRPALTLNIKINSKWIKDLNVRTITKKLLLENTGGKLPNIGFGNNCLNITLKTQVTTEKKGKLDYIKI